LTESKVIMAYLEGIANGDVYWEAREITKKAG
jgi:hypothetical protein